MCVLDTIALALSIAFFVVRGTSFIAYQTDAKYCVPFAAECLPRQPTDSWQGPHCGLLSLRAVHPRNPAVGLQPPPDGPQPKVESAGMTPTAADRPQRNAPDPRQKQLPCCVPSSRVQLWATDCVYAGHFSYFSLIRLAPILTKDF